MLSFGSEVGRLGIKGIEQDLNRMSTDPIGQVSEACGSGESDTGADTPLWN